MYQIVKPILLLLLLTVFVSCNITQGGDDPKPNPTGTSKTELLAGTVSKAWVLTSSKINGKEVLNQALPCTTDNSMVFKITKAYEWSEGGTKCRENDLQVYETGTWEFNTGETEIVLNKEYRYRLLTLEAATLKISIKSVFGETQELTFKPQ